MAHDQPATVTGMRGAFPPEAALVETLKIGVAEVFTAMVGHFELCTGVSEVAADKGNSAAAIEETIQPNWSVDRIVSVAITGEFEGTLLLRCSAAGALDIARGLLMLDDGASLDVPEVDDALKECANMLCGYMKTKALDPHGHTTLGIPVLLDPTDPCTRLRSDMLVYRLQRGMLALELRRRALAYPRFDAARTK